MQQYLISAKTLAKQIKLIKQDRRKKVKKLLLYAYIEPLLVSSARFSVQTGFVQYRCIFQRPAVSGALAVPFHIHQGHLELSKIKNIFKREKYRNNCIHDT